MTANSLIVRSAEDLAHRIAQLADPNCELPRPRPHETMALAGGYSGCAMALMYAGSVFDDDDLKNAAQTLLKSAAESTVTHKVRHLGLIDGLAVLATTLVDFAKMEPRYYPALQQLANQFGTAILDSKFAEFETDGVPFAAYDVISGAAGQLATTLRLLRSMDRPPESVEGAAQRLTDYLMRVTDLNDQGRPGWLLPPRYYPDDDWSRDNAPHGMYNLGFAHGMPGILAALSAATIAGIGGEQVTVRVRELALWLTEHSGNPTTGPSWPLAFSAGPDHLLLEYDADAKPARAAWCYGAPGIALALLSAATVTNLPEIAETAISALRRVTAAGTLERGISTVTLCHGHAGLATVAHRAARMTGLEEFTALRDQELQTIVATADPSRPFLFADQRQRGEFIDDPGFLTGSAGVLLGLLTSLEPTQNEWEEILFLTPSTMNSVATKTT